MLSRKQLTDRVPFGYLTIARFIRSEADFPKPEKHGKSLYFDWVSILKWLETRASKSIELQEDDLIWDSKKVSSVLGRSLPWINQRVIQSGRFTRFNLSPSSNSKCIKNYFLAREIVEAFPELVEIAKNGGADDV